MAIISVNPISTSDYSNLLYQMLLDFESEEPLVYADSDGNATIGIGFELSENAAAILSGMGYTGITLTELTSAIHDVTYEVKFATADLAQLAVNEAVNSVLGKTEYNTNSTTTGKDFGYGTSNTAGSALTADQQIQKTFDTIIGNYESTVDAWLLGVPANSNNPPSQQLPPSNERAALASLAYNNLIGFATDSSGNYLFNSDGTYKLKSPALQHDILNGDRAEAWYEIRYDSNGGASRSPGIANRRYEESQVFGLFQNAAAPTWAETVQAYQMLALHRDAITVYDNTFWNPSIIQSLNNTTYASIGTPIESLSSSLTYSSGSGISAATQLVETLQSQYAILAHADLSAFEGTDATNIFLNPGRASSSDPVISAYAATLDASYSAAATGPNLLIASTGGPGGLTPDTGADTLIGGQANDTLYAGSGADTFDYASSSDTGIETIVLPDPSGSGSASGAVEVGALALTGGSAVQGKPFTWTDGNGTSYVFTPGAGNPSVGTLTVSGGALGTGGGEIVLQNFNLDAAMSGAGELGITLGSPVALSAGPGATAGPFASGDYVADGVTTTAPGSVGQALTVSLSATSDTAQQVTVSLIASMKAKAAAMMLPALLLLWTPALAASPDFPFSYHFTLTKGTGIPVCEADLKRLNTATYSGPPGCDQPQTTSIPGFAPLHRVFLSSREVQILFPRVTQFMAFGKQGSKEQDEAFAAERKKLGLSPTWTLDEIKGYMRLGYIKVWRYDPPVDIDNDGRSTSLVIWQGVPISNAPGVCGKAAGMGGQDFYIQPQIAFVLAPGNNRLDTRKTKALFGHAGPRYRFPNGMVFRGFRPLGTAMGIFRYRGLYYFDTFFNGWGGSRTSSFAYYPALTDILGVFVHRNGKTGQVCEYHMTTRHINNAAGD